MSYKVCFGKDIPQIVTEHGETILEAAIRGGVYVNYGCSSGNCGLCHARLIEGDIQKVRHYDHVFTAAQKAAGHFLLCSFSAASDVTVATLISDSITQIEAYQFAAKVRSVKAFDDRITSLVLQVPRSLRLRFVAGQYAKLTKNDATGEFSIASCPCDARRLEFHIPRLADNPLSRYVFESCAVGDSVNVNAPFGEFVFTEDFVRPIALIAFDEGFAPIKSLFEHISAQESEVPIHLYRVSVWDKRYLDNLCRSWNDGFDQVNYRAFEMAMQDSEQQECVAAIIDELSAMETVDIYCCAPAWVGTTLKSALLKEGDRRVFWEPVRGRHEEIKN